MCTTARPTPPPLGGLFDILAADAAGDRLPSVSWVVAPEAYTEHPAWPGGYGAWYTAGVLNALTSNPEVWSKTALLLTFDENDGFFDHLVSPYPNVGGLAGQSTVALDNELFNGQAGTPGGSGGVPGPYGLGVRVPLIVISPWSTGGWVCSETFDHTSLIRLIEARFGVDEPNITPWRRAVCGDLTSAFDFRRSSDQIPPLPSVASDQPTGILNPPTYVPTPPTPGSVAVALPNPGTYDLSLHGPNGFFRHYAGSPATVLRAEAHGRDDGGRLTIRLSAGDGHRRHRPGIVVNVADAYGADGQIEVRGTAELTIDTRHSGGWYDIALTTPSDSSCSYVLAGRLESGGRLTSDPQLGRT